jgi:hypothetical protein
MPYPARDNAFPPAFSTRFTSFASQLVLSGVGNSSPAGVKHLPCQVVVEVSTADTHFDYKDGSNVLVAMNFDAVGHVHHPHGPVVHRDDHDRGGRDRVLASRDGLTKC